MTWSDIFIDAFKKNDALIHSRFMKGLGTGRGGALDA